MSNKFDGEGAGMKRMFCLAALMLPVSIAAAQGGRPQPRPVLEALDVDHDGMLSSAEIKAAPQSLRKLDLNHDGQLTPDEIVPRLETAGAKPDDLVKQLMLLDKNGDGVLTQDELPARMAGMFKRGDTNHDGKLTADEIRAMAVTQSAPNGVPLKAGQASGVMRMDPVLNALDADHDGTISASEIAAASESLMALDVAHSGGLSADVLKMHQMTAAERADHLLEEWDTNKDGKLSKDEAPERMVADFAKIDTNGDGFADKGELTKYFEATPAGPRRGGNDEKPVQKEKQ
jgi:Ca2+-binding EF-hand superfamily protein